MVPEPCDAIVHVHSAAAAGAVMLVGAHPVLLLVVQLLLFWYIDSNGCRNSKLVLLSSVGVWSLYLVFVPELRDFQLDGVYYYVNPLQFGSLG